MACRRSRTRVTRSPGNERSTSIATHSRVKSSTMFSVRKLRPSASVGGEVHRPAFLLHGLTVYAASGGKDQGATFRVRLPLRIVHPEQQPEERRVHPRHAEPGSLVDVPSLDGTHVPAVGDDPDALGLLREMLGAVGASVTTATSGRAALEVVEADRPNVLVADLGMP